MSSSGCSVSTGIQVDEKVQLVTLLHVSRGLDSSVNIVTRLLGGLPLISPWIPYCLWSPCCHLFGVCRGFFSQNEVAIALLPPLMPSSVNVKNTQLNTETTSTFAFPCNIDKTAYCNGRIVGREAKELRLVTRQQILHFSLEERLLIVR
jgi:hypothetical protein